MSNLYPLIGGPCSGKTTTLKEFAKLGYNIVNEAATELINEWTSKGGKVEELRKDENKFTMMVLERAKQNEKKVRKDTITFLDRGMPDTLAYNKQYGVENTKEMIKLCMNRGYKKVFFLESVPYQKTNLRTEDKETAEKLGKLLHETYRELGYLVINVPLMPVEKRVSFILEKIK